MSLPSLTKGHVAVALLVLPVAKVLWFEVAVMVFAILALVARVPQYVLSARTLRAIG